MLDDFSRLKANIEEIAAKHRLSIFQLLQKITENHPVPASIFCKRLSPLESMVKFLRETYGYNLTVIARLLNRSPKTIWQAVNSTSKKHPEHFSPGQAYLIPLSLFSNRSKSILAVAVSYLHEEYNLTFARIADLIERNPRTIWAVYNNHGRHTPNTSKKSGSGGKR